MDEIKSSSFPWQPTERTVHLCIDMQGLFAADGPWPTPWLEAALPNILRIAEFRPERAVFTRLIPPRTAENARGTWRHYYDVHAHATRQQLKPVSLQLLPPLAALVPPALVVDKPVYSAFLGSDLRRILMTRKADGLIITGAETDVCVLATVLDAVDLGYPVFVISDAICSSTDASHDAVVTLYRTRFYRQVQVLSTDALLERWPRN
ncbi:cysteine hydrolase family protein [Kaistia nematophila]|uniref:Cysteine hydrolase n=1 Tax=Kaistia nematophila TaxID=2994654 RepID=A0A9X3IM79_9HYPH|nr:cysteine hydrolase [Kaistia nematophila]